MSELMSLYIYIFFTVMTIYCISTFVSRCVTICGWTILLLYDYSRGSRERSL